MNQKRPRVGECVDQTPQEEKNGAECFSQPSHDDATGRASDTHEGMDIHNSSESSRDSQESETDEETASETVDNDAIRRLKLDMEENKFCYIPPRVKVKRYDYLHYVRKKDSGALTYVAHADYYILLRACARAAQVDIRIMHIGVLSLERRLAWLEKRIDKCLHVRPPKISCQFCSADGRTPGNGSVEEQGLSNLTI